MLNLQYNRKKRGIDSTLKDNEVPTAIHYPTPLHLQECYQSLNHKVGDFPISKAARSFSQ